MPPTLRRRVSAWTETPLLQRTCLSHKTLATSLNRLQTAWWRQTLHFLHGNKALTVQNGLVMFVCGNGKDWIVLLCFVDMNRLYGATTL